jgi:FtsP/CotA-like multicopper oxidase with cupredoxin domain
MTVVVRRRRCFDLSGYWVGRSRRVIMPVWPKRSAKVTPVLMSSEWRIDVGTRRPNPIEMTDFNVLTFNGRAFPGTAPLVAKYGDRVRIRFGNLSPMEHHPIHLHGYYWKVTEMDGLQVPESAQQPENTVLVAVGQTRAVEFIADNPGDWAMHCHMTHHTMNQMGHNAPNLIGVRPGDLAKRVSRLLPGGRANPLRIS